MSTTIRVTVTNEMEVERELVLPATFEVCGRCEGHGTHLNPSIGEHAYSQEEFDEAFDDDESREAYFKRGGMYDVQCQECHGKRVVAVLDESRFTKPAHLKLLARIHGAAEADAEYEAICRMERAMGC